MAVKILIAISDVLIINLAYLLAFYLKFDSQLPSFNFEPYLQIVPFISLVALILFNVYGLLSVVRKSRTEMIYSIGLTVIMLTISSMALTFLFRGFSFPRTVFALAAVLQFFLLSIWHLILWTIQKYRHGRKKVMIVGTKDEGEETAGKIIHTFSEWFQVKYICKANALEGIDNLINSVDIVIICPGVQQDTKERILQMCLNKNKEIHLVPDLFEILMLNSKMRQFDDVPTLRIDNLHLTMEQRIVKRVFDFTMSFLGILVAAPIMLILCILIKLSSPGPILYSQQRVGRDGKVFNLHKFRSMVPDAEKLTGPVLATDDDPRITKIGKIMRATRLDELPQFFNVLKGDMSLVGPRPERPFFVDKYIEEIPAYAYRSSVKSGITGLAQVLGKYRTTPEDKLRFDLLYVRNYSFLLDLKLILQTIKILFVKGSSQGTTKDEKLKNLLKKTGLKAYEESGVIRIDEAV